MRTSPNSPATRSAIIGTALVLALALGACGDDENSEEDAFCDAATSLEQNVGALAEMDVAAEGTNALDDALGEIEADLTALREAGSEVAEAELDDLFDAVDSLEAAATEAADSPSTDDVAAIVSGVVAAVSAADAAFTTLQEACG